MTNKKMGLGDGRLIDSIIKDNTILDDSVPRFEEVKIKVYLFPMFKTSKSIKRF